MCPQHLTLTVTSRLQRFKPRTEIGLLCEESANLLISGNPNQGVTPAFRCHPSQRPRKSLETLEEPATAPDFPSFHP